MLVKKIARSVPEAQNRSIEIWTSANSLEMKNKFFVANNSSFQRGAVGKKLV